MQNLLNSWPKSSGFSLPDSEIFPLSLEECPLNVWFQVTPELIPHPEGLPHQVVAIDFEWSCTSPEQASVAPLIGTARGPNNESYFWISSYLTTGHLSDAKLCSIGSQVQLVLCHNASADLPRLVEQPYCFDTSAVHLIVAGAGSQQTWGFKKSEEEQPYYTQAGALKNLLDTYNFWESSDLQAESKNIRNIFYKGTLEDIRENFSSLMDYSLRDPLLVARMTSAIWEAYLEATPLEASRWALFHRGRVSWKPIPGFSSWFYAIEQEYMSRSQSINQKLVALRDKVLAGFISELPRRASLEELVPVGHSSRKKNGELKKISVKKEHQLRSELDPSYKAVVLKYQTLYSAKDWSVYTNWMTEDITYKSPFAQQLCQLKLKTGDYPKGANILYEREIGFYYWLANGDMQKVTSPKKGPQTKDNCGSLFGKDFISLFEDGLLFSDLPEVNAICSSAAEISYWTSIRSRLQDLVYLQMLAHQA